MNIEVEVTVRVRNGNGQTQVLTGVNEKWHFGDNPRWALAGTRHCVDETVAVLKGIMTQSGEQKALDANSGKPVRVG